MAKIVRLGAVLMAAIALPACVEGLGTGTTEDDALTITTSVEDAAPASEGDLGANLIFRVSLSEQTDNDVTIAYETKDGTATAGADYTAQSGTVTIKGGTSVAEIGVPVMFDNIDEPDETVILELLSTSAGTTSSASATGMILDDDPEPSLTLSSGSMVEGNSGQATLDFTVSLSAVSGMPVSFDFATSDGTAVADSDYLAVEGSLTIPAGSSSATVGVAVLGDVDKEINETFDLSLSNVANAIAATSLATGTITDDDDTSVPEALFISVANAADAGEGGVLQFAVTLSEPLGIDVAVRYTTVAQTATAGSDFVPVAATISIPAGSTSANIAVGVLDDEVDEQNESVGLQLISVSVGFIGDATATGSIIDDDPSPALSIADAGAQEGNSGQKTLTFIVTSSAVSGLDVAADFMTVAGSATAGDDFTAASGTVLIPAGSTQASITVSISGDTASEPDEQFQVVLSNAANATLARASATGAIANDDSVPSISIANASRAEGNSGQVNLNFVVSLSGASSTDVTVNYATSNGTATAGEDYQASSGTLTIAAGDVQGTITVKVIGDTDDESNETLTLALSSPNGATIGDGNATGTINDDDSAPSISVANASVSEGNSGQANLNFVVSLNGTSESDVSVNYATSNGTATAGDDYVAASGTVTIAAGDSQATITVKVNGDTVDESNETLNLTLSSPSGATIADGTAVGTINDNDSAPSISVANASVSEGNSGQSNLNFVVSLSSTSGSDVSVNYATSNGTATAGDDYVAASGTVTIAAGDSQATITVKVNGDTVDESNETLNLTLSSPSGATIADGTAVGTINDNDSAPSISVANASRPEGDSGQANLNFVVSLSAAGSADVSVNYATSNGTATAGDDYDAASGTIMIAAGDTQATITVKVNGDTENEANETINLTLSNPSGATISDANAVGTINDDDSAPSVSVANASRTEGNSGQANLNFVVSLSATSGTDVIVDYATSDGSATAGEDYDAASGSLTIAAGNDQATVAIKINGDTLNEPDEQLTLTLTSATGASIGDGTATGTITNDDSQADLRISNASRTEGNSGQADLNFTISLNAAAGSDVTVNYATSDGTAEAGEDYVAVSGTATIAAGDTSTTISVPVTGDTLFEADETFTVSLSNASNASIADSSGTGTINDNDSAPAVSIADASRNEGNSGTANLGFVISIDAISGRDTVVSYTSSNGTATAGADYNAVSATTTLAAGSQQKTVNVPIRGDTIDEIDEMFSVTLSNPSGATLLDDTGVGTINDDDPEPSLSVGNKSISEGNSGQKTLNFTVSLSAESSFDVTVNYATSNGTASAGSDYVAKSGSVSIDAGATTATVGVQINGDTVEEGNETFTFTLSNASNASIGDSSATGTITNDDTGGGGNESGLTSRPSNTSCLAGDAPSNNVAITNTGAFSNLPAFVKPVTLIQAPGDNSEWFVVEQDGRVLRFNNSAGASSVSTFIDIRSSSDPINVYSDDLETGLLGMAFHPDYGNGNWEVYLSYMTKEPSLKSVVAKFESKDNGQTLDATDATVLITLDQPNKNHNSGHLSFGPDGYLYVTFGDGGPGDDPDQQAQNTSTLFGSMIRINVDSGSPYSIPGNNPFAGNAKCNDGDGSSACPEIYAWGFRNPWRWSFDEPTGELWLADVGQGDWEEVNKVERGGNYGWRCRQGAHPHKSGFCPGGFIDPIIEYSNVTVGDSITGGFVYRGNDIPQLTGRYVFADYIRGKIFASVDNGDGTFGFETLQDTSHFIASFAIEADGELLYLDYLAGRIRRIVQSGGSSSGSVPDKLSQTGCVNPGNPKQAASGLIPYEVNVPFWSDGAGKNRWYSIPNGKTIDVDNNGDWLFPTGTVLMKNFKLNSKLIETRLFMRHNNGSWAGYTYEWNSGETEANRVVGGKVRSISGQDWIYPSGTQCMECHTQAANFSLGIEHGQLNNDMVYPSTNITANQLTTADAVDLLADPLSDTPANLPRYPDPTDTSESLEDRARAYMHSNCAGCHRPGGPTPSDMDLRFQTSLRNTNTCNVTPTGSDLGISNARIIMPGDASKSVLVERVDRRDSHGMPPVGSSLVDNSGVQLLRSWVNSLGSCP